MIVQGRDAGLVEAPDDEDPRPEAELEGRADAGGVLGLECFYVLAADVVAVVVSAHRGGVFFFFLS